MTAYVILRHDEEAWVVVDQLEARSARGALWAHLNGSDKGGEYVAVPERSWRPMKVSVETKRSLRFG